MAYPEEEYLMISGIQHFKFCRRQWALIHVEQQWEENVHTVIGELMHKRVHDPYLTEKRAGILVVRALPVASREMGVSGECELVQLHKCEDGISLPATEGSILFYPVEYKKGKPKLTERTGCSWQPRPCAWKRCFPQRFPEGAVFYGETRRRETVVFTEELRQEVRSWFSEMHEYYRRGYTPKVKRRKACSSFL